METMDYKNIRSFSNVKEGQAIAELIPGAIGQDSKNVYGEIIKKKSIRNKPMKVGKGCKIEGNKVIATKSGRPDLKSNIVSVNTARGNIKLGTVGSPAGVNTKLEILPDGIITAKIAHSNTIFCFGNKWKTLESSGKDVKAYMKKEGEIVIDKFVI